MSLDKTAKVLDMAQKRLIALKKKVSEPHAPLTKEELDMPIDDFIEMQKNKSFRTVVIESFIINHDQQTILIEYFILENTNEDMIELELGCERFYTWFENAYPEIIKQYTHKDNLAWYDIIEYSLTDNMKLEFLNWLIRLK
jgi:hypothetical protein